MLLSDIESVTSFSTGGCVKHAVVYTYGYRYGVAVHMLLEDSATIDAILEKAMKLARDAGASLEKTELRYVGVEDLPVSAHPLPAFYVVERGKGWSLLLKRGDPEVGDLVSFKEARVTIDYDYKDVWAFVWNAFTKSENILTDMRFFKTAGGAHLRARALRPLSFDEKVKLRYNLWDDDERVFHDVALEELGLLHLTDCLFHEKMYRVGATFAYYREEPLFIEEAELPEDIRDIARERKYETDALVVENGRVRFKSKLDPFSAFEVMKDFVSSLRSLAQSEEVKHEEEEEVKRLLGVEAMHGLKAKLYLAYKKVGSDLGAALIHASEVKDLGNIIVVSVPWYYAQLVGALIGRGGATVKAVEEVVGKRISIEVEGESRVRSEQVKELEKKYREFMRSLAEWASRNE